MLNLYLLKRTNNADYGECAAAVVVASSEDEARQMVSKSETGGFLGADAAAVWLTPQVEVKKIGKSLLNEKQIVLEDRVPD